MAPLSPLQFGKILTKKAKRGVAELDDVTARTSQQASRKWAKAQKNAPKPPDVEADLARLKAEMP